jgi:hypothetical protein
VSEAATLTGRIRPRAALWGRRLVLQVEEMVGWGEACRLRWRDASVSDLQNAAIAERIYGEGRNAGAS